jgi:glutamate-1-semialdehyde 2,1-aminomutase
LEAVEAAFDRTGEEIAAVIVEPVPANMGVILPAEGFLKRLRELCEAKNALLIFDEVITGFRLARGGAQELFGVTPDLTCLGKVMGGGLPCAAFGGHADLMERLAPVGPVYQAGTLSGNPVAVAAGLAALELIDRLDPYSELRARAEKLCAGLEAAFAEHGVSVAINRVESLFSVFFSEGEVTNYRDAKAADHGKYARFFHGILARGVYLPPSGYEAWFLSTAHTDEDIARTTRAAAEAVTG